MMQFLFAELIRSVLNILRFTNLNKKLECLRVKYLKNDFVSRLYNVSFKSEKRMSSKHGHILLNILASSLEIKEEAVTHGKEILTCEHETVSSVQDDRESTVLGNKNLTLENENELKCEDSRNCKDSTAEDNIKLTLEDVGSKSVVKDSRHCSSGDHSRNDEPTIKDGRNLYLVPVCVTGCTVSLNNICCEFHCSAIQEKTPGDGGGAVWENNERVSMPSVLKVKPTVLVYPSSRQNPVLIYDARSIPKRYMNYEVFRLCSMRHLPFELNVFVTEVAEDGFFSNTVSIIECYSCGIQHNLQEHRNVHGELRHRNNCDRNVDNRPLAFWLEGVDWEAFREEYYNNSGVDPASVHLDQGHRYATLTEHDFPEHQQLAQAGAGFHGGTSLSEPTTSGLGPSLSSVTGDSHLASGGWEVAEGTQSTQPDGVTPLERSSSLQPIRRPDSPPAAAASHHPLQPVGELQQPHSWPQPSGQSRVTEAPQHLGGSQQALSSGAQNLPSLGTPQPHNQETVATDEPGGGLVSIITSATSRRDQNGPLANRTLATVLDEGASALEGGAPVPQGAAFLPLPPRMDLRNAAYPQLASAEARRNTYTAWSPDHPKRPEELVYNGFFFAGYSDCVRCFYCGVGLKFWRVTDIPAYQHARFRPHCVYSRMVNGQDYIDRVQGEIGVINAAEPHPPQVHDQPPVGPQQGEAVEADAERLAVAGGRSQEHINQTVSRIARELGIVESEVTDEMVQNVLAGVGLGEMGTDEMDSPPVSGGRIPQEPAVRPSDVVDEQVARVRPNSTQGGSQGASAPASMPADNLLAEEQQHRLVAREHALLVERTQCMVCSGQRANCIFLPCGHVVACVTCAETQGACVVCHKQILATANVYLS